MAKKYLVKVYNKSGSYLNTWDEVISNISFQNEINTAGGQMTITLARKAGDYGEGSDIDFGFKVRVYVFDKELPTGKIIFQGYISGYTPIYKDDTVQVTVLSYGSELNDIIIEETPATDLTQTTTNTTEDLVYYEIYTPFGPTQEWDVWGQSFKPSSNQNFNGVITQFRNTGTFTFKVRAFLYATPPTTITNETIFPYSTTTALGISEVTEVPPNSGFTEYTFRFDDIPLLSANTYYIYFSTELFSQGPNLLEVRYNSTSVYANGVTQRGFYGGGSGGTLGDWLGDFYFKTLYSTGATNVPFTSQDPSNILKTIIDVADLKGSQITYDSNTVETTGSTVSYTFKVNTVLEGVQKCVELAPKDWYWYIDYANNKINFKEKANIPNHTFTLEKDLLDAKFEKRIEDVINVVYFTGGETGGTNFYKKYSNQDSIDKYGVKSLKYTDQRVTLAATADTIANSILETRSQPELRVTLEVLDSNNEQGLGYDIESINVGDTIAVRNVTQQVGLSTWDVARWDEAYWDYNIYNLSSLNMQIQRIEYHQDRATIYASTIAVDINKRIEDINRNLEQSIVTNNPTTPS